MIIALNGACRKQELREIKLQDIEDTGNSLIIKVPNIKNKTSRTFVISEHFYSICKQYINLRPKGNQSNTLPFFLNYQNGKCTTQCVGINKLGNVPMRIAEYLGLPDPRNYTGHCFRRSSAAILADTGTSLLTLKRHGGWRSSSVAEGYVDNSIQNISDTSTKIASAINHYEHTKNMSQNILITPTTTESCTTTGKNLSVSSTSRWHASNCLKNGAI